MAARDERDLTQELHKLKHSLHQWRRKGSPRCIPPEIWEQAVAAADEHGVGAVVRHVGLDHSKLKSRLAQKRAQGLAVASGSPAAFFELLPSPEIPPQRCVIEVESGRGARMRLDVASLELPGLVTLVRGFVN